MMPQLDKFTYFTQFFWLCLIFFTFYISLCRDGVPRISRILKLRNQLVPHQQRGKPRNDPNSLEEILGRGFSTGVSYMYSSLFEVSQWCDADLQGRKKITYISCFGERSGSRRIERNVSYLIPKSSYHTCSSLSEVRLCYFIELPSSMMDYADLCFFLKDIIQKVGVGYRIILTQKAQKESPYKSADGLSSELILGLEGLELNKQVINGLVSHKKEVGKIGITKLKSFHRLCSLVMAEKDNEYPLVCWGVSSEEVAARSLASRQKIGLKQAAIKTFRGESRNRPTAIPAISSYVEEAGQPDPNNIGVSSNLPPEGGPHGSNLPPEGGPHGSDESWDEFWVWWEKRKEMLREHRRNRRGPMDDWAFFGNAWEEYDEKDFF